MSDQEFSHISKLMHRITGKPLPAHKKTLVADDLQPRVDNLKMSNFGQYIDYIAKHIPELHYAIYLLGAHETAFFRHPQHYRLLADRVLPHYRDKPMRLWSAATSTGEEACSMAMVLMSELGTEASWHVTGTDISEVALEMAKSGLFARSRMENMPTRWFRPSYCQETSANGRKIMRIAEDLQQRVLYQTANLAADTAGLGTFDVIFLCNVLFYFDAVVRRQIVDKIVRQLNPGGWLFVGPAEVYSIVSDGLVQEEPTLFRRVDG